MGDTGQTLRSSYASLHLDLIRGLSALAVLLGHLRGLLFVDFQEVESPGLLVRLFYFLSGFGHQAVMVFFVLSGYFISCSIFEGCRANRWSWRAYAINRISRLHVVLIPGLVWTMTLDYLGMWLFPEHPLYRGLLAPNVIPEAVSLRYGLGTFFGNVACLQDIVVVPLGSNGALWSLSNEFWYYVIFPLLAVPFLLKVGLFRVIASVLAAILLLGFVGVDHAFYFLIWLVGTGIALHSTRRWSRPATWGVLVTCLLLFLAALLAARARVMTGLQASDLLVGGAFGLLVLALLQFDCACNWGLYHKLASGLAGFSYSLYVFHLPLLVFLAACLLGTSRWQPAMLHLTLGMALLVLVAFTTYLLSQLTEAHTNRLRCLLMRRIRGAAQHKDRNNRPAPTQIRMATDQHQQAPVLNEGSIH